MGKAPAFFKNESSQCLENKHWQCFWYKKSKAKELV